MTVKQHLTAEELMNRPEEPGKRFELVEGQVVEKSLLGAQAAVAHANLLFSLGAFVQRHDRGIVLPQALIQPFLR